jgi:sigma-E factor negative regulatory protein RseA
LIKVIENCKNMKIENNIPLSELQNAQISDLADGQLRGDAFADALALLETSSSARAAWHGLHVAGDLLRANVNANATVNALNIAKDMAFLDTFRSNLAKEPHLKPIMEVIELPLAVPTANDSFFNWKWVGGLSAAAAVVAFSWNLVSTTATAPTGSGVQLAQNASREPVQAAPVATQTTAGVMLRNPQLDALIAAHNQVSGSSALQMPSGFLRSATFNTTVPATASVDK